MLVVFATFLPLAEPPPPLFLTSAGEVSVMSIVLHQTISWNIDSLPPERKQIKD